METQLRGALVAVQVVGALLFGVGIAFVIRGMLADEAADRARDISVAVAFMLLPGPFLFFTARTARRRLSVGASSARTYALLAGFLTLLASLPFVLGLPGIVGIALGLFTVTAAWLMPRRRVVGR